jgi:hypothetical protein
MWQSDGVPRGTSRRTLVRIPFVSTTQTTNAAVDVRFREDWAQDIGGRLQVLVGALLGAEREQFEDVFRRFAAVLPEPIGVVEWQCCSVNCVRRTSTAALSQVGAGHYEMVVIWPRQFDCPVPSDDEDLAFPSEKHAAIWS